MSFAFLNSAKKASHSLNLAIPSLKHAPVSLAGALEEYLKDPNFEQNRKEYKENKRVADGAPSSTRPISTTSSSIPKSESKKSITIKEPEKPERKVKPPTSNQDLQDFFESIDNNGGQNIFSNVPAEQAFFLQAQPTGMMGMNGGFGGMGMGMGGLQPQMTGYNPFMAQQQTGMQMPMQQQMTGFGGMQPQMTGFIQPQATGFNPFRASVMPQPTGFGGPLALSMGSRASSASSSNSHSRSNRNSNNSHSSSRTSSNKLFSHSTLLCLCSSSKLPSNSTAALRSASQPAILCAFLIQLCILIAEQPIIRSVQGSRTHHTSKALLPQKTGSRNPFAPPPGSTPPPASPPAPRGPSLNQLAMSAFAAPNGGHYGLGANAWDGSDPTGKNAQQQQQQQTGLLAPQKTGLIGSVASEFTFQNQNNQNNAGSAFGSASGPTTPGASVTTPGQTNNDLSSQFGGMSFGQPQQQQQQQPQQQQALQPQPTGFGASSIRPFKPESSFGSSLAADPQFSTPASPGPSGLAPQMTGNPFARVSSPPLQQPSFTGFGGSATNNVNGGGSGAIGATSGLPSATTNNSSALNAFNSAFSSNPVSGGAQQQQQQQSNGSNFASAFNTNLNSTANSTTAHRSTQIQQEVTASTRSLLVRTTLPRLAAVECSNSNCSHKLQVFRADRL